MYFYQWGNYPVLIPCRVLALGVKEEGIESHDAIIKVYEPIAGWGYKHGHEPLDTEALDEFAKLGVVPQEGDQIGFVSYKSLIDDPMNALICELRLKYYGRA